MQFYTESIIKKKSVPGAKAIKFVFAALAGLCLFLSVAISLLFLIGVVVFGFIYYVCAQYLEIEYEYIHTNEILDIDMVMQKNGRKSLLSIDLNNVTVLAPLNSPALQPYRNMKGRDFSGGMSREDLYVMVCTVDNERNKLLLKLEPKMLKSLKDFMPTKIMDF